MKQPAWATRQLERICQEYEVPVPTTKWTRKQRYSSSGRYRFIDNSISVNAGSDTKDQRVTFLHEVAHHIHRIRTKGTGGHTALFWDIAFELFHDKRNRVKKKYALDRSARYKQGALKAYARKKLN